MTVIEDFVGNFAEPQRSVLLQMRRMILTVLPEAEECIYYGIPCFKAMASQVAGFKTTSGALHFSKDECLSQVLVRLLIETRLAQIAEVSAHAK